MDGLTPTHVQPAGGMLHGSSHACVALCRCFQPDPALLTCGSTLLPPLVAGVVALGVSVVQGPFTWLNQACWAAYVGTVVATVRAAGCTMSGVVCGLHGCMGAAPLLPWVCIWLGVDRSVGHHASESCSHAPTPLQAASLPTGGPGAVGGSGVPRAGPAVCGQGEKWRFDLQGRWTEQCPLCRTCGLWTR